MKKSLLKELSPNTHFLLNISVKPNSKSQKIDFDGEFLFVSICSPPDKGKANKELIQILSDRLEISSSYLSISAGHKSRDKVVEIKLDKGKDMSVEIILQLLMNSEK